MLPRYQFKYVSGFEITGIDFVRKLILSAKEKVCIVLFTYAIYLVNRLINDEIPHSRVFFCHYRDLPHEGERVNIFFIDNGFNFFITNNELKDLD